MPRKKKCATCDVLARQVEFLQGMVNKFVAFQCPEASTSPTDGALNQNPFKKYEDYIAEITGASDDKMEFGNKQPQ